MTCRISIKFDANDLSSGPVRLVGGSWSGEGRVEIHYNGAWGTVCGDDWDINDAQVVCRSLGYPNALDALIKARFGQGSRKIWLDNVNCSGHESSIAKCFSNGWGNHDCSHDEDASVICSSKYVNTDLLFLSTSSIPLLQYRVDRENFPLPSFGVFRHGHPNLGVCQ